LHLQRPTSFVLVGACCATVHYAVAWTLLTLHATTPQPANFCGWAVAFAVSYLAQSQLTFAQQRLTWTSFWRFLATSLGAWLINAGCFAALLATTSIDPRLLLGVAILIAAAFTYRMSQSWAFGTKLRGD
jgi:putative flippase GtrA